MDFDVVVGQGEDVMRHPSIDLLGVAVVQEVGVVNEYLDRKPGPT